MLPGIDRRNEVHKCKTCWNIAVLLLTTQTAWIKNLQNGIFQRADNNASIMVLARHVEEGEPLASGNLPTLTMSFSHSNKVRRHNSSSMLAKLPVAHSDCIMFLKYWCFLKSSGPSYTTRSLSHQSWDKGCLTDHTSPRTWENPRDTNHVGSTLCPPF